MSVDKITVVVPIGPNSVYLNWVPSCLYSIMQQTVKPEEIILISDMAPIGQKQIDDYRKLAEDYNVPVRLRYNDWLLGPYASWNIGVAVSKTNMVLLMGSDDMLYDDCLEETTAAYHRIGDVAGFYNLACEIGHGGEQSNAYNNAAVVTRNLWNLTGGFPLTANLGGGDAMLISIMMVHLSEHLHQVNEDKPLYWVRVHEHQDTRRFAGTFHQQVIDVRNIETERWERPTWTS